MQLAGNNQSTHSLATIMPPLINQVLQDQEELDSGIGGMNNGHHQSDETNGLTSNVSYSKNVQPELQRRRYFWVKSRTNRCCELLLISSVVSLVIAAGIATYQWKKIEKLRKDLDTERRNYAQIVEESRGVRTEMNENFGRLTNQLRECNESTCKITRSI